MNREMNFEFNSHYEQSSQSPKSEESQTIRRIPLYAAKGIIISIGG